MLIVLDQNRDFGDIQDHRRCVSHTLTTTDALIVVMWESAVSQVLYNFCCRSNCNIHISHHSSSPPCIASCSDGQIKLIEGSLETTGRVEICFNKRWETVPDDCFTYNEATVACKSLGFDYGMHFASKHRMYK